MPDDQTPLERAWAEASKDGPPTHLAADPDESVFIAGWRAAMAHCAPKEMKLPSLVWDYDEEEDDDA